MENVIQYKNWNIKVEDSEEKREFTAIITDDSVDRDREVLLPSGMNKKDFVKNGIILFNHDPNMPIGTTLALRRSGNAWKATGFIAEGVQKAEDVWSLIKQGVLKGISVGFQIEERRAPTQEDKKMFGKAVESVISKWKLLEFSVVSVGCNQNALITGCKDLAIDAKDILGEEYKEEIIEEAQEGIEVKDIEVEVSEPIIVEEKVVSEDISKLMELDNQIEAEIKALETDIELDEETKEKLIEVVKTKNVDLKDIMFYFKEAYKKEIKKSRGMLY